jgi:Zn finger protein HypA/HybF involved in hydrogenase expression
MHEYSLMENIIETILLRVQELTFAPGEVLRKITLEIGALELHSEESFQQAYLLLAKGTALENTSLDLKILPATIDCPSCHYSSIFKGDDEDVHASSPYTECPSCSMIIPILGGKGIGSIDLVIETIK